MIKPTFCFLDESGTLNVKSHNIRHFAVGAIIHSNPDDLIIELHNQFEALCSKLKKDPTRLEFKFSAVTQKSLPFYENCLKILTRDKNWRFCSFVVNLDDSNFNPPKDYLEAWECYLRYTKLLLQKNLYPEEKTTLIADYLRKPKKAPVHSLSTLPSVVPQLWDVLQVESQGVLLVQMVDVLLGGSLYKGKDKIKLKLVKEVDELKKIKGKNFNEWKVKWKTKLIK